MNHMNKLEKALSGLLDHGGLTNRLAQVLARASERGRVSYCEVEKMVNGDAEVSRAGIPIYEVNLSLFVKKG